MNVADLRNISLNDIVDLFSKDADDAEFQELIDKLAYEKKMEALLDELVETLL